MATPKELAWTRDELVLALDVALQNPDTLLPARHPSVLRLSSDLRRLDIHPRMDRTDGHRTPHGVAMKIHEFTAFNPESESKPTKNKLAAQAVADAWTEFEGDAERAHAEADRIREAHLVPKKA